MTSSLIRTLVFSAAALPITLVDLRERRIPDPLSLGGLALLALFDLVASPRGLATGLATAAGAALLFWLVYRITGGLGLGDVKYAALVGLFAGLPGVFVAFAASALGGLAYAAAARLLFGRSLRERLPYAPFLTAGAFCALAFELAGMSYAL